ncbi:annexin A8 isoform X6 [Ochotona curzoniae]|uniref:annexin A8 isoform X6 n=1 Tax=Ochotona curzoniae TaxID=130825 RepID=UPI001B34C074|nr:annexin A8 isoform X6 [Ochotona curzoniae]
MAWWKAWIEQEGVTVKGTPHFNPDPDAETLYKAMKGIGEARGLLLHPRPLPLPVPMELGWGCEGYSTLCPSAGTNEQAITDVLTRRSNMQRQQIAKSFKAQFGKDLTETLKSELSGKFERLIVALMYPPYRYEAKELHDAMKGSRDDVSGFVDPGLALQDAQDLYAAGEKINGTDEMKFITILCTRSAPHLMRVKCTRNVHCYFAERLHYAMKGAGTLDGTLIRNIVSRSEIDLNLIKNQFKKMYGKTLSSMITEDTSGDYKNALLSLVGNDP